MKKVKKFENFDNEKGISISEKERYKNRILSLIESNFDKLSLRDIHLIIGILKKDEK